jgi:membrane-associated phospholipid phosphatase
VEELPFSIDLIRFLADARTDFLTAVSLFFTFLGEVEGYVLVISLIYVAYDKKLAFRLSVLTLITMSLNHLLKMLVMNPRPFITEGSYAEKWAVSPAKIEELATEYSTPSGHAMAGSGFYSYLYASVHNRHVRIACVLVILLTGLSRPYLGVHYLEDVLIGWVLGISIALVSVKYAERIGNLWSGLPDVGQIIIVGAASLMLWIATGVLSDWSTDGQPLAFVSYTGFLMGVVVAYPLEAKKVNFDPRSSTLATKALRLILCVGMVMGTLLLLDGAFGAVSDDYSVLGYLLRYLRYATAAVAGIFLGPLLFVRLGLADRLPGTPGASRRRRAESGGGAAR